MSTQDSIDRRKVLQASALGILGLSLPSIMYAGTFDSRSPGTEVLPPHYPHIDPLLISEVVGKAHFDLEALRKLVDPRPELSRSVWEWRYGDFESALGAASHVGRRDIALYLINKGARPTLFTFAMLGNHEIVKAAVEAMPGIQRTGGPHGISLLSHAEAGLRMEAEMSASELEGVKRTIDFLEVLGDAKGETYIEVSEAEQQKYLGNYRYGEGETEGFTISLNMRKLLSFGPIGGFGGALYKVDAHTFIYNGAPSVRISFEFEGETVKSLTVTDPTITLTARKV